MQNVLILIDLHDAADSHCGTLPDYGRLLQQVADSGYRKWIEVEYEGPGHSGGPKAERKPASPLSELDGCLATKRLLQKLLGEELGRNGSARRPR